MDGNLIYLYCSVLTTGGAGWVKVPVSREVLDQGEDVRDEIRSRARRELQGLIFRETGTLLPDDYMAKVPVEEVEESEESEPAGAVPTSSALELVGGPGDGCRFTVAGPPPMRYLRPITPPVSALLDAEPPPVPLPVSVYEPIMDEYGMCSRADVGSWRYGLQP